MTGVQTETIASFDGTLLAVHRLAPKSSAGRPLVLLHGLFSSAEVNWIKFGHAQALADAGFEVIMPDLRAHGHSAAPHDPAAYPADVLCRDAAALVEALGLVEYDLAGFSLGARTAVSSVLGGHNSRPLAPRRLGLCGMGLQGLSGWARRGAFFVDAIDRFDEVKHGDPAFYAVAFMKQMKVDRVAARLLLQAVDDIEPADLAQVTMPTAVICGDQDRDNGSPAELAEALPDATHIEIPGTHMSCVTKPELGAAIADFLAV